MGFEALVRKSQKKNPKSEMHCGGEGKACTLELEGLVFKSDSDMHSVINLSFFIKWG